MVDMQTFLDLSRPLVLSLHSAQSIGLPELISTNRQQFPVELVDVRLPSRNS